MHDPGPVRAGQAPGHLFGDDGRGAQGQAALAAEALAQVLAFEQLHDEVGHVPVDAVIEDLHHVRATQLGGGTGFPGKASAGIGGLGERGAHELDGHVLVEREVVGDPDRAHPSGRELAQKPVLARDHGVFAERNQAIPLQGAPG
ncbi:MAG: hypothetical protein QM820_43080 [Minicystis sp.]